VRKKREVKGERELGKGRWEGRIEGKAEWECGKGR
jgi:hypothetical protein